MVRNGYVLIGLVIQKESLQRIKNMQKNKLGIWNMQFEYPWLWKEKNKKR